MLYSSLRLADLPKGIPCYSKYLLLRIWSKSWCITAHPRRSYCDKIFKWLNEDSCLLISNFGSIGVYTGIMKSSAVSLEWRYGFGRIWCGGSCLGTLARLRPLRMSITLSTMELEIPSPHYYGIVWQSWDFVLLFPLHSLPSASVPGCRSPSNSNAKPQK